MVNLLLATGFALICSLPIAFFAGFGYFALGVIVLGAFDLLNVRSGIASFLVSVLCAVMTSLTFFVAFAHFSRSF